MDSSSASELQAVSTQPLAIESAPTVDTALPAELVPITDANAATPNLLGNDEMEKIGGKRKRRLSSPDDEFLIPHVKTSRRRTLSYM